nr:hypothetical protein [Tanacetum cinerariifolium]
MEADCVNLELKYQNQALKEGKHGQFSKVKSNEAKVKHDIDVIETINIELEHKVAKLLKENETLKRHYKELFDSIKTTRTKTIEHTTSLIAKNDEFKAQLQEKGKPVLQQHKNQSVIGQSTAFKSERPRISKPWFAFQVDVDNDLPKPVTTRYLPKGKESVCAKPHHMIAPSSSRYRSNDIVHNHYLEEAKKNTQESSRNLEPNVMPFGRSQSTANEVNSRAKVPSNKTTNKNKLIEQTSVARKPERQILKGHRFSIKKAFVVHEKTMTPRSCLRWKPMGKIFKFVGLRNLGFKECCSNEQEMTSDHNSSELEIHDHSNEPYSSKLVPKVFPPVDKTATSRQELELLFHHHITMMRYKRRCYSLIPAESNSLPHAHAQTTKTYYKHQVSSIKKA